MREPTPTSTTPRSPTVRPATVRPASVRPSPVRHVLLLVALILALAATPAAAAVGTSPSDPGPATSAVRGTGAVSLAAPTATLDRACPDGRFPRGRFVDVGGGELGLAVDCLAWYGVTLGVTDDRFDPGGTVTRGQMARFLARFLAHSVEAAGRSMPTYDGRSRFRDVPSGAGNAAAIAVLSSPEAEALFGRRVVTGLADGTFRPDEPVTREQMGTFLARTFDAVATVVGGTYTRGSCRFRDSDAIATVHRDNVHLVCEAGVGLGYPDGTSRPAGEVTRGQMARFLVRLQDLLVGARWSVTPDPG